MWENEDCVCGEKGECGEENEERKGACGVKASYRPSMSGGSNFYEAHRECDPGAPPTRGQRSIANYVLHSETCIALARLRPQWAS